MTSESIIKIAIDKINFEEKWLKDVKMEQGFVSISDIEIAMDAIRSAVKGGQHE